MHRTNLKGVNFSSSASKTRKPCVIGSPGAVTCLLCYVCMNTVWHWWITHFWGRGYNKRFLLNTAGNSKTWLSYIVKANVAAHAVVYIIVQLIIEVNRNKRLKLSSRSRLHPCVLPSTHYTFSSRISSRPLNLLQLNLVMVCLCIIISHDNNNEFLLCHFSIWAHSPTDTKISKGVISQEKPWWQWKVWNAIITVKVKESSNHELCV